MIWDYFVCRGVIFVEGQFVLGLFCLLEQFDLGLFCLSMLLLSELFGSGTQKVTRIRMLDIHVYIYIYLQSSICTGLQWLIKIFTGEHSLQQLLSVVICKDFNSFCIWASSGENLSSGSRQSEFQTSLFSYRD